MERAVNLEVMEQQEKYESEVRNLVLAGYNQAKSGKTQDFNEVCDRLVKTGCIDESIEDILENLTGIVPDDGKTLEEYREERIIKKIQG